RQGCDADALGAVGEILLRKAVNAVAVDFRGGYRNDSTQKTDCRCEDAEQSGMKHDAYLQKMMSQVLFASGGKFIQKKSAALNSTSKNGQ
ncbi:MAG: hypothetical protein IJZ76_03010, partial [Lachnospiraceae bacterium]|nr:hypothetical protein [Lachnospiraceae bacterium]